MTTPRPNAYDPPKWEPTRRTEDEGPLTLGEAVGQSLGEASACWENLAGAGIFDSTRCGEIYEWLMAYLSDWAEEIRKQANEATAAKARAAIADEIARGPAADHHARLAAGTEDSAGVCAAERRGAGNICETHGCVYPGDNPGISCRSQL